MSEVRLIDSEELIETLCIGCMKYSSGICCNEYGRCAEYSIIKQMPTIDAEPVLHGRWIPYGCEDDDMWICSNCMENVIFSMHESDRVEKQRYCCRCGARMDDKGVIVCPI